MLLKHFSFSLSFNQLRYFTTTTTTTNSTPNSVSLYLQRSKLIDSIRLALRSNSPNSLLPNLITNNPNLDSFVITHSLNSAPSPDSALSLLQTLKTLNPNFSHNQFTLHTLAKILAKSQRIQELQTLINEINTGKFTNVSRISFMDLLRWNSIAGDLDSAIRVWNNYRNVLPGGKKFPCTESYNILLSLYVYKGKNFEAVEFFKRLIDEGVNPNPRTLTVVIDHLVSLGKLDAAKEVFDLLPLMRMKRTLKQYSILVEGFSFAKRFDVVKKLVEEMRCDGLLPSGSMRMCLKGLQDAGCVEGIEDFVSGLEPDRRIRSIGSLEDRDGDGVQLKPWLNHGALANALSDWNADEVSALEDAKFVWTTRLVCKMLRSFKKVETAWKFFCWVAYQPGEFTHDVYTISRMIAILARHGQDELVDQLISKVKRERIQLSFSTVRLIIDFYGISKKPDAALKVFYDVETISGAISQTHLMLLYSSLLRTLIKCKRGLNAMDLVEEMILSGINPDMQTFTGLMQYFALEGDLRTVQKLFGMVRQSGVDPDAYMFQIIIRAYCKRERAVLALRIYEDMRNSSLIPDSTTKALLVKSLWKEGKLREAAYVEEISEEVNDKLPLALPGHLWTVSTADLTRVYDIYFNSIATDVC
ncbi:hypothetical protein AQUCO_01000400v1 [Aquilegia coerulea]|uniref:Pentacotripeptide-repeat region of PRORP domain-containing protein n=1 Tax=Aquilegia coerulea TaxID=218851 RepID=A0A2G5EA98_AQUCA|nr:hypothetical protein AQUCO_01000400v1 [Aquilegia coerulea]